MRGTIAREDEAEYCGRSLNYQACGPAVRHKNGSAIRSELAGQFGGSSAVLFIHNERETSTCQSRELFQSVASSPEAIPALSQFDTLSSMAATSYRLKSKA